MTNNILAIVLWTCAACIWVGGAGAQAQAPEPVIHPMDALTAAEYEETVATLLAAGLTDEFSLFPLVTLHEPEKNDVLEWRDGDPFARAAFVVVRNGRDTFQGVVDISRDQVVSWQQVDGEEPGMLMSEEWNGADRIVRAHAPWREAVSRRGLDLAEIVCVPLTVGYFGLADEEGRRLVKVVCYSSSDTQNFWGRPIEDLVAVVDLNERTVIDLVDTGHVPIPRGPVDFDEASVGALRAPSRLRVDQPDGPGFTLSGNMVRWQGWEFHVRVDPRLGLVLSRVMYDDAGSLRSVLYQASLSELFVPYMDPSVGWFFRTYLDAGEYGVGRLAVEMQPGLDCPEHAVFKDAVFVDDYGEPYRSARAACVFERDAGDIAWRHTDAVTGQSEVRRSTELVVRLVSAIGNYDYVFDWVFRQDGAIRVMVGASGVEQVKAVASRTGAEAELDGPGFTLSGNMVRWQGWEFHVRVDPRLGLVLSRVMYDDAGSLRSVLYQASLSELRARPPARDSVASTPPHPDGHVGGRQPSAGSDRPWRNHPHLVSVSGLDDHAPGGRGLSPRGRVVSERAGWVGEARSDGGGSSNRHRTGGAGGPAGRRCHALRTDPPESPPRPCRL